MPVNERLRTTVNDSQSDGANVRWRSLGKTGAFAYGATNFPRALTLELKASSSRRLQLAGPLRRASGLPNRHKQ
jgi:hypothetical protein